VSPGLVRYVAGYREQRQPERKDNHPFCFLTLDEGVSPMSYKFEKRSSPNHSTRQHYGYPSKPTGITIHHWGNPGQTHDGVVKYLCREGGNTSAHEVISAGRVTQLVEHDRAAWHAGSTRGNGSTIGLECRPEMSAADWATLVERCADIEEIHGSMRYYRHSDWKATACPGKYGPRLGELIEAVNAEHARRAVAKKPLPETGLSRRRADLAAWRKRLGSKRPRVRAAIDAFLKGTPKR
jgi:N-acetylmuramoyl-L-alanine amidase CwlA